MSKKMIDVTVTVANDHKHHMEQVIRGLKSKGFVVSESLNEIGVLLGSVAAASLSDLSAVPGVSAVEKNRADYRTQ